MGDQFFPNGKTGAIGELLVGRYRLLRCVGQGAMGDVYKAYDAKLDRQVAIKILRGTLVRDEILRARFEREARAAGKLFHHPNVVTIFDVDESDGQPFIVMEFVSGGTLSSSLASGPLPVDHAVSIARQTLSALAFAHSRGVIHRDIKPSNIFISDFGEIKVGDFGIARVFEGGNAPDLTLSSQILGTPAYLPPERADGGLTTPKSDVFSVGVMLYEMVTGERPFSGDSPIATVMAVKSGIYESPKKLNPYVPDELVKVIDRALQPLPESRFSSARHMMAALELGAEPQDTAPLVVDSDAATCIDLKAVTRAGVAESLASGDRKGARHPMHLMTAEAFIRTRRWLVDFFGKLDQAVKARRPHFTVVFLSVAVAAFIVASVILFGEGSKPPSRGLSPSTSLVTTTTLPTPTTSPPTTAAPPTTSPSHQPPSKGPGKVPPGLARKVR